MNDEPEILVIADTSVLINFVHASRLDLLGAPLGLRVLVPIEVLAELVDPTQRALVDQSLATAGLAEAGPMSPDELAEYARLRATLGAGESAALAIARWRGAVVACDEKRAFLRTAASLLGPGRVANTPGLLLCAIHRGLLTLAEADHLKGVLEGHRFKMNFSSFADLVTREELT